MKKYGKYLLFAGIAAAMLFKAEVTSYAYDGEVYWDNMTACWDEMDDAVRYQVQLYRGSEKVSSHSTAGFSYNFTNDITRTGNYRFRVREYADGSYGDWSQYSDLVSARVDNPNLSVNLNIGSQSSDSKSNGASSKTEQRNRENELNNLDRTPYREGWQNENGRWRYQYADGSYVKDKFQYLDGKWYNFDENGYMRTGWYLRGSVWFYLKPDGAMATGWEQIDQKWYYFDESNGFMVEEKNEYDHSGNT